MLHWLLAGSVLVVTLGIIDTTSTEAICLWPPCNEEVSSNSSNNASEESTTLLNPSPGTVEWTTGTDPKMGYVTNSSNSAVETQTPDSTTLSYPGPGVTVLAVSTSNSGKEGPTLGRYFTESSAGSPETTSGVKGPTPPLTLSQSTRDVTTTAAPPGVAVVKYSFSFISTAFYTAVGVALVALICAIYSIVQHKRGRCSHFRNCGSDFRALVVCRRRACNPFTPGDIALTAIDTIGDSTENLYLGGDSEDMV
jgi:hypothetical protein